MKRQKDATPVQCKLCQEQLTASGMPSHLYRKHNKLTSQEYVERFGEFRQKYLLQASRVATSKVVCKICNQPQASHKQLLHHLHSHQVPWQEYYVTYYFNGKWPVCECGCGERVKLLRHGKNEKGEQTYARTTLAGHCPWRVPGYRSNTLEQRENMRRAAIQRIEQTGAYFKTEPTSAENEIVTYLQSIGVVNVEQSNRTILAGLELDIYLPDLKIGIEYNGNRFHSDLFKKRQFHLKKTKECNSKSIKLIHIWECDYIKKKSIVLSNIKAQVGKIQNKLYARKCKVITLSEKQARVFLEENHLQGSTVSKIRLGLVYQEELVAVMSFSKLRKATGMVHIDNHYELVRFCNKKDTTVIGGASKLFTYFIKHYTPERVLSYANRDWSMGTVYEKLGMKYIGETPPGYFYTKSNYKYSRFAFTKHKLVERGFDPQKSEYQIMQEQGYYRIWDCGNLKYEWTKEET